MSLFAKAQYQDQEMPFIVDDFTETGRDHENGFISIEASGQDEGRKIYCYSTYSLNDPGMYENGDFEALLNMLRNSGDRTVTVKLKYKKDKLKDFEIDTASLARIYGDDRFLQLELLGWGLNEKSCREVVSNGN